MPIEKKEFMQAIFCAPSGSYEHLPYPSRLTDEVFKALKDVGINRIYGCGWDTRRDTQIQTLKLCEKHGIKYLPEIRSAFDYVRIKTDKSGKKPFRFMTEEEKEELDKKFIEEIKFFTEYPAFGGIFFKDEPGFLSLDGIARAKRVFDKHYSQYEFHFNNISYSINDAIFWGGFFGNEFEGETPFELTGDLAITFENRFNYYDLFVEEFLSKAPFEFMSWDRYPFENVWQNFPNAVHVALFELNDFFLMKKRKYGNRFCNFLQAGTAVWDGNAKRPLKFSEAALQMHVTVAYGGDGFNYFPGCYPVDWIPEHNPGDCFRDGENGKAGLIDIHGKTTFFYDWTKILCSFFKEIENDILSSTLLGLAAYGVYDNGFDESLESAPDNECIFKGNVPISLPYVENGLSIESSNQVMVSTFENNGKKRYYLVNTSTVYDNELDIRFPEKEYEVYSLDGKMEISDRLTLSLGAGCGTYIVKK